MMAYVVLRQQFNQMVAVALILIALNISSNVNRVGRAISESGVVKNVEIAAETASLTLSVQKLFPLPVLVANILGSRWWPMSGHLGSVMFEWVVVENA